MHRRLDGDGINDRWPLFYDNYFVPRGYAVHPRADERHRLHYERLPASRRAGRHRRQKSVIDWLNGRAQGFDRASTTAVEKVADWHNG